MSRFILLFAVLLTNEVFAANIAIIDLGMPISYRSALGANVIHTECFSKPDKYRRETSLKINLNT